MAFIAASALATPALAQRDVTRDGPSVRDVAMTPITDLNLRRDPIPEVLLDAREDPYESRGLASCDDIRREVADLDAVLGDDFDTAPPEERGVSATGVAQKVVASFIPFRGILRELTGANAHEFNFREAIGAGMMRRAFLKGIGREWDCPYPASPAPRALVARLEQQADAPPEAEGVVAVAEDGTRFVAQPVVQGD